MEDKNTKEGETPEIPYKDQQEYLQRYRKEKKLYDVI